MATARSTQQNSYSISHLLGTVTTQRLPLWRCSHCSLVPDTVTTEQWLHRIHTLLGTHYHRAYVEICLLGTRAASESRENESRPEASSHGYWIHKLDTRKTARVNFTYVKLAYVAQKIKSQESFCANIMNISCFSHHINLRMCWWKFTIAITLALYIATLPMLQSMLLRSLIQCLHQTFDSAGTKLYHALCTAVQLRRVVMSLLRTGTSWRDMRT